MVKSVFITSPSYSPNKVKLLDRLIGTCSAGGAHRPGYFKPLITDDDAERIEKYALKLGVPKEELYGLKAIEAVDLMNKGQESLIIEKVLEKFNNLGAKFECVPVEGTDLEKYPLGIQSLDAVLAANLAAPVVIIAGCSRCAASGVRYFKNACAEIVAIALVGDLDSDTVKSVEALGYPVVRGNSPDDVDLGVIANKVESFQPKVVTPKKFEYDLIERAKSNRQRIVLPEGTDDRILLAADAIIGRDFASIVILGEADSVKKKGSELNLKNLDKAEILDQKTAPYRKELVEQFYELRKAKGITPEQAETQLLDRNWFGTMMVKSGKADGMVSGAAGSTADTIRPALSIIKTKKGISIASSVFLMCLKDRILVFGDCAIVTNPTPQQLSEIAIISAHTAKAFGVEPKVGLLSYSTGASGTGPDVDAVKEAVDLAKAAIPTLYPGLLLDGPMQFDAALDEKTAKSKMPGSPVAGQATVLIFPTLNAGNIGYKAVQRTAGAVAVGPIIQGLNAPVNDLSRGCTVPDIINTVAITACQAQAK
jgi:phosphate acetyltransferase